MARYRVGLHAQATAEARAAFQWYRERNPAAAGVFLAELDRAVELIAETPETWPPYIRGTRRFPLHRFPYSLVFRVRGEEITVVAIAHHRRRPGYWKNR